MGSRSKEEKKDQDSIKKDDELEIADQLLVKSENFLSDLDVAREMFETVEPMLAEKNKKYEERADQILNDITNIIEDNEDKDEVEIPTNKFQNLKNNVIRINKAVSMFRQQSTVLLISKFDEFITQLLRIALKEKPEKLKSSDKSINYNQVFKYDSIADMVKEIVRSEIDSLMRQSHAVSILFLDESFKLGIKDNYSSWPSFIELTQRRNLFVHSGGKVTNQYIETCKKEGVNLDEDIDQEKYLRVDHEYFQNSFILLYELGLRTSQALYRRLFSSKLEKADTSLNEIGYDLMLEERWELANTVFNFATSIPDHLYGSKQDELRFIINQSICNKRLGNKEKMEELLNSTDWSAYKDSFRLAKYVLKEDYKESGKLMKAIDENEIRPHDYRTWPLFSEFRTTDTFQEIYIEKFGEDFKKEYSEKDFLPEKEN